MPQSGPQLKRWVPIQWLTRFGPANLGEDDSPISLQSKSQNQRRGAVRPWFNEPPGHALELPRESVENITCNQQLFFAPEQSTRAKSKKNLTSDDLHALPRSMDQQCKQNLQSQASLVPGSDCEKSTRAAKGKHLASGAQRGCALGREPAVTPLNFPAQ